jgi:hypothetical protein
MTKRSNLGMLLFCYLVLASIGFSQSVSGYVVDRKTKESLIGADVIIKNTFNGSSTNTEVYTEPILNEIF